MRQAILFVVRRGCKGCSSRIRLELERTHSAEVTRLREQLAKVLSSEKVLNAKLSSYQPLLDKLNNQIHQHNVIQSNLNSRIAELEGLLEVERGEKKEILEEKQRELLELEQELKAKDSENQQVLDANVALRDEIRIYSNLLDVQEKSLEGDQNASPSSKGNPNKRFFLRKLIPERKRRKNQSEIMNDNNGF